MLRTRLTRIPDAIRSLLSRHDRSDLMLQEVEQHTSAVTPIVKGDELVERGGR